MNNSFEVAESIISELENKAIEIMEAEEQRGKK